MSPAPAACSLLPTTAHGELALLLAMAVRRARRILPPWRPVEAVDRFQEELLDDTQIVARDRRG